MFYLLHKYRGTIALWFDICLPCCGPRFDSGTRRLLKIDRSCDLFFEFYRPVGWQMIAGRLSGLEALKF